MIHFYKRFIFCGFLVIDPKMRLGTVIVVLTECMRMSIAQGTGQRELFSWTEALNSSGGSQSPEKPAGKLNQVQRPLINKNSEASRRIGYGYTKGSHEFVEEIRKSRGSLQRLTTRPRMSLASALDVLKKNNVGLTGGVKVNNRRQRREGKRRPELRQLKKGRRVAHLPVMKNVEKNAKTGYGYTRGSQEFLESW